MPLHENARFINLFNVGRPITYQENIASQLPGIIQYLPLNEVNGIVAADASGNGRNGSYSGVTLSSIDGPGPSMGRAGRWDGVNDLVGLNGTSWSAAFNPNLGSWGIWLKVFNAAVWSDGSSRDSYIGVDVNNFILLRKSSVANTFTFWFRTGGGSSLNLNHTISTTDWFHVCFTWNKASNRCRAYINGTQITGSPTTYAFVWAGSILNLFTAIGGNAFASFFNGYAAHSIVSSQEWNQSQVTIAATSF